MKHGLKFLGIIFISVVFSGCSRLSPVDLSGAISLQRQDNGPTYQEIHRLYRYDILADGIDFLDWLLKIVNVEKVYPRLEFQKDFLVTGTKYTAIQQFQEIPPVKFNYFKILDDQGQEISYTVLKENIAGDEKLLSISRGASASPDPDVVLSGSGLISLVNPATNLEYLVETEYFIKAYPRFKKINKHDFREEQDSHISIFTETKIGSRYCLAGELALLSGKKLSLKVVDWNLDGVFDENDRVQIEKKDGTFPFKDGIFSFNEIINLGSIWRPNRYILRLIPGDGDETGDPYRLQIESVEDGVTANRDAGE